MTRGVLREHDLFSFAAICAKVIDAMDLAAGYNAITATGPINLLAHHRNRPRVFDQFRRKQRDHIQRAPEHMALARSEQVARLYWIIDHREVDVEAILLCENTVVARVQAGIRHNDWGPSGQTLIGNS